MNIKDFIKFDNKSKSTGLPSVSMTSDGAIFLFNAFAIRRFKLEKYKFVEIYFNKKSKAIGFKFLEHVQGKGAYKISKGTSNISISAKAFTNNNRIEPFKKKPLKKLTHDFFVVDIETGVNE